MIHHMILKQINRNKKSYDFSQLPNRKRYITILHFLYVLQFAITLLEFVSVRFEGHMFDIQDKNQKYQLYKPTS